MVDAVVSWVAGITVVTGFSDVVSSVVVGIVVSVVVFISVDDVVFLGGVETAVVPSVTV